LLLTGRESGWIPNFHFQRPVIERSFAGIFIDTQNVDLAGVHQLESSDAHRVTSLGRQLRRVGFGDAEEFGGSVLRMEDAEA
jgi:hypothetical protein